jgi:Abnormal spindle-like microcephaly-assoc'd, ASPM-SPD-2-Hydin
MGPKRLACLIWWIGFPMRRYDVCLVLFLLVPAFSLAWPERRPDVSSSSKGLVSNACGNNPGATNPYSNKRFSLGSLIGTTTSGTSYVATVDVYAWGDYNCSLYVPASPASGEDPSTEDTILAITIATPTGAAPAGSYKLLSFRLNSYLPVSQNLSFISCQLSPPGITPCDNQSEDDISPVPEPAPISGADGNGSLWTFGDIFQLSGTSTGSTPLGPPIQLMTTPPELAAALLVPGCAPDLSATPPQSCIGTNTVNYSNSLSPQTTYTVEIEDISSGQILILGTPSPVQAVPGKGHDVFSATTYNPVAITTGVFANQIYDLSANYPQLDGTGAPTFNGFAQSAFPPPCATNSGTCTADDTFANMAFHAMWFDFVPQINTPVSLTTASSHFDTILSVFTGAASSLQGVPNGINDDNRNATIAQNPQSSAVVFQATKGVTYHILVSEYPPMNSVNPVPDPGFDVYEAPLSTNPIVYFTLTTPQLTASPSMLQNFGSVTQGASSAPQTVTLAATYSASSSGISNIMPSITAGSSDFQIAPNSTCLSSLADQATCTLAIVFTPATVGARSGVLTVSSSAENSPITISLAGAGVQAAPVLSLSTAPLSFSDQLLKTSSNTNSVVLTNSGSAPIAVSAVSITGDFSETNNCSSIAAAGQCSIAVTFTPTQTGPRTGQLSITDNVGNSPQLISLSGTGTDFALQAASGSQLSATVAQGATATYTIAVIPIAGFTGPVALSCAGAPTGATCAPSATSVNVTDSAASVTLSVATSANATLTYPHSSPANGLRRLAAAVIPLGAFTLMGAGRRKKLFLRMAGIGLFLSLTSFVGCGGKGTPANVQSGTGSSSSSGGGTSSSGGGGTTQPPAQTTTLTVSGVSGTQTRTVTLTLTVQ